MSVLAILFAFFTLIFVLMGLVVLIASSHKKPDGSASAPPALGAQFFLVSGLYAVALAIAASKVL